MDYPNLGYLGACCDGGGSGKEVILSNKNLFVKNTFKREIRDIAVQAGQIFAEGELVKIDSGAVTKLTAAPAATDNLAIVYYKLDNTTLATTEKRATPRASVISSADGINQDALILPASVTVTDQLVALLAGKGIFVTRLYGYSAPPVAVIN